MNPHSEKFKKGIQKIIYQDLEIWKQHINDLEAEKIDKNTFKQYYVKFLQKIEDNIAHFTEFYLKKQSHAVANQILEDNLEKTAMLETAIEFLSESKSVIEAEFVKEEIIHKRMLPSPSSPVRDESSLIYRASEIE